MAQIIPPVSGTQRIIVGLLAMQAIASMVAAMAWAALSIPGVLIVAALMFQVALVVALYEVYAAYEHRRVGLAMIYAAWIGVIAIITGWVLHAAAAGTGGWLMAVLVAVPGAAAGTLAWSGWERARHARMIR